MESNFKAIIDTKKPVLVSFYTESCPSCKSLMPVLESVKTALEDAVKIVKINVDKNPLLATTYQIKEVPTLLLFKNGFHIWRHSGMVQMNGLLKIIRSSYELA